MEIPQCMKKLTSTWMLWCGATGGDVYVNGKRVQNILSQAEVRALKVNNAHFGLLHILFMKYSVPRQTSRQKLIKVKRSWYKI